MSVALRWATSSARRCFRAAASAFFCALRRARSSRSAWTAASPSMADLCSMTARLGRISSTGADLVDLAELLGRDQPVRHHRAVDELRARVVGRGDQVAAAEEGAAQQVPTPGGVHDLLASDGQVAPASRPSEPPGPGFAFAFSASGVAGA